MKEIDDLAQALMELGVESGIAAETARQLASTKTIEMAAFEWAAVEHTTWLSVYSRTKKKRTKKKHSDRIMNAWAREAMK
jgi:hypothetical protein